MDSSSRSNITSMLISLTVHAALKAGVNAENNPQIAALSVVSRLIV